MNVFTMKFICLKIFMFCCTTILMFDFAQCKMT